MFSAWREALARCLRGTAQDPYRNRGIAELALSDFVPMGHKRTLNAFDAHPIYPHFLKRAYGTPELGAGFPYTGGAGAFV